MGSGLSLPHQSKLAIEEIYLQNPQNLTPNDLKRMKNNIEILSEKLMNTISQLVNNQQKQKNLISDEMNNLQNEINNKMVTFEKKFVEKVKNQITMDMKHKQQQLIDQPKLQQEKQNKNLQELLKRVEQLQDKAISVQKIKQKHSQQMVSLKLNLLKIEDKLNWLDKNNNSQALQKRDHSEMNVLSKNFNDRALYFENQMAKLNDRALYFENQMANYWAAQIKQVKDQISWISHKMQTQIGNLNLEMKTKSSNILQKVQKMKKVESNDGGMTHFLKSTDIQSCQWVHKDSYFYQMLTFSANHVSFMGNQKNKFTKAFVLGCESLSKKFCFTIQVGKINQMMAIGVISSSYLKTLQVFQNCNRWLFFFSDGSLMGDGNISNAIKKRDGYNQNDIIKVSVDLKDSKIEWSINGRVQCIYFWERFRQTGGYLLPCVVLSRQSSFSIIQ